MGTQGFEEVRMLLGRFRRLPPRPAGPARAGASRRTVETEPRLDLDEAPEDRPQGCGWFDSSRELRAGLWVQEHATTDAVDNELPLATWLEWNLAGPRGRRAA
jgi:hypothetical protein